MRDFDPRKVPIPPNGHDMRRQIQCALKSKKLLMVEIGAGTGSFSLALSEKNPEAFIISVEKTHDKFRRFSNKLEKNPPHNLICIQGDAIWWISAFIPRRSVDQYFILYPNPYPKRKQKNLRWPFAPFTHYLVETMKVKGQITLATNKLSYKEDCIRSFVQTFKMNLLEEKKVKYKQSRTDFEKKYIERNESCYNLIFEKPY